MKRNVLSFVGILTLALLSLPGRQTFAQDDPQPLCDRPFDQYGDLRACDHSARLDNFAIQIQNMSEGYGYVIVYAPASAAKHSQDRITDYLVNVRGISPEKIKTVHGGLNSELSKPWIQVWIVPKGAEEPKPRENEVDVGAFKGMLAEYEEWDNIELVGQQFEWGEEAGNGPPVGNVTFAAFDEVFKAQKNSVAHVIGFNGKDSMPGAWKRVAESTVESLKKFGFDSSRFQIGYGGQSKEMKVQLWILPKGELPPTKDPASAPPLKKALRFGEFDDTDLGRVENEQLVLSRIQTVMRENPELRAVLIVKTMAPSPEEETGEPVVEPIISLPPLEESAAPVKPPEPEPDPADLFKLAEKWKGEITKKSRQETVVLFGTTQNHYTSFIEVWMVPPGQPLPNPNAPDAEEAEEEPAQQEKQEKKPSPPPPALLPTNDKPNHEAPATPIKTA